MIKDYVEARRSEGQTDEITFVEDFWTSVWKKEGFGTEDYFEKARAELIKKEELKICESYLSGLPKGARILDGGCGVGLWSLYFQNKGFEVYGLDISRQCIEILSQKFPGQHFSFGDIRKTGFPDNYFDAYFSWGTFEHFEDGLGSCFEEARRILKPGGLLLVSVPFSNKRHVRKSQKLQFHLPGRALRFYQWRLTEAELALEFGRHGFEIERPQDLHYISKEEGVLRYLTHEWKISGDSLRGKVLRKVLKKILPDRFIAHMILGVGRKQE